jgi:aryl-alcohol dehydrogenase-like predicted oxidoreductase
MEQRTLGRSGITISAFGFGCGAVGGVLVKGERREQLATVARALELGVTYFDTAPVYGDGLSETNLGEVLHELGADVVVGTKVRLEGDDYTDLDSAVTRSVERSLGRLKRETIDLIQLHNFMAGPGGGRSSWISVEQAARVIDVLMRLRDEGKVRAVGINGLGDMAAVRQCLSLGVDGAQVCLNLLNPTASVPAPARFPFDDQQQVIGAAGATGAGVLAIRVLGGGALGGSTTRPANAADKIEPIASSPNLAADMALAERFRFLVAEGFAATLPEAAIRFAASRRGVTSALVGISSIDQLEAAAAAIAKGPLPAAAEIRLRVVWAGLAKGDTR